MDVDTAPCPFGRLYVQTLKVTHTPARKYRLQTFLLPFSVSENHTSSDLAKLKFAIILSVQTILANSMPVIRLRIALFTTNNYNQIQVYCNVMI